ncbi:ArpU family phage packaging/lysis transcriptional regulator [Companilactobacillus baiquanensis]|uniref:ArpU family phage packaging/lysis transcriptional regulator n=1 Tax=Companilactobacillus baiquanensis TaxID=2486005 RepID=A0ABW1V0C4_9LACO|nr:ArpU family phage packaging/lysis transcriptional regulator [Companilactobacillus baiquanensis]
MSLFPEIDETETINNVVEYFERDFPRLIAQSHLNLSYIQSPKFDVIGGGGGTRNSQEDKLVDHISAPEYVKATMRLINNCPDTYRTILKYKYVYGRSSLEVTDMVGYGQTRYNELRKQALLYFADAFMDFEDLHIYLSSKATY